MKIHVQQDSDSWRDKVRRKVVNKNHLAQTDMEQESQGGSRKKAEGLWPLRWEISA